MLPALEHLRLVDVCCQQPLRSASLRKLSLAFTDSSDQPRHAAPVEHSSGPGASQQGGRIRQQYDLPRPDFDGCPNLRSLSVLGGVLPGVILDAWRPSLAHVTSLEVRDNAGDLGKLCCGDAEEGRAHRDLDIQGADRVGRVAVVRVDRGGRSLRCRRTRHQVNLCTCRSARPQRMRGRAVWGWQTCWRRWPHTRTCWWCDCMRSTATSGCRTWPGSSTWTCCCLPASSEACRTAGSWRARHPQRKVRLVAAVLTLQTAPGVEHAQAALLYTHRTFSISTQNRKPSPDAVPCYCNLARWRMKVGQVCNIG